MKKKGFWRVKINNILASIQLNKFQISRLSQTAALGIFQEIVDFKNCVKDYYY